MASRGTESLRRFVERPRLTSTLDAVPPGGVGLVIASAGWGKSVLLDEWAARTEPRGQAGRAPVALVRVSTHMGDQAVLARELFGAVASAAPGVGVAIDELVSPGKGRLGPAFVRELLERLDAAGAPVDIVIDDAHLAAANAHMAEDLGLLLTDLPDHVRAIVGSRWDLDLDVHKLRLEDRLVEVRAADLAFTPDEAAEFVQTVAQTEIDPDDMAALASRTSGWAAGLQLAALSIRTTDDPHEFIRTFDGTNEVVAAYLTQEVLQRQKPETRAFLMQTSVLPWLSAELCAAATDSPDIGAARKSLEDLRSGALFVSPVDPHGHRLRYHQLFADLLRYQLAAEHPEASSSVRRRAATWLEQNGYVADAGEQLLALGDPSAVLGIVRRHGDELFARNESATLLRWLDGVATDDGPIDLLIDRLAAEMATHETSRVRSSYRRLRSRSDVNSGQRAAIEALYSCAGLDDLSTDEITRSVAATTRHLERAGAEGTEVTDFLGIGGSTTAEAMASYMGGIAALHAGDLPDATERLRQTLTLEGTSYPLWKISALSTLALARAWAGWHERAVTDARSALQIAASAAAPHHHAVTHAQLALAATRVDRLELDLAREHLAEAWICTERSGWAVDRALHHTLTGTFTWLTEGAVTALELTPPDIPPATLPRIVECTLAVNRARLLAITGSTQAARDQLTVCPEGAMRSKGEIDVALAHGDLDVAGHHLSAWHPHPQVLRDQVGHRARRAVLDSAAGRNDDAVENMAAALAQARGEKVAAVFLEIPGALDLLRSEPVLLRDEFAVSLLEAAPGATTTGRSTSLPEPLTERETQLLPYLPTRLTNAEIADRLYVSVNTVKTHLRHIYWKLGVENRDAAVVRAAELGLL